MATMPYLGGLTDDYPDDRLRNAWIACRHLYPSITYRKVDAAQAQEYRNYGLCMREHGMIEGVPWVEEDGTIADKNNSATRVGPGLGPVAGIHGSTSALPQAPQRRARRSTPA